MRQRSLRSDASDRIANCVSALAGRRRCWCGRWRLGNLSTPNSVQKLQTALHAKAKAEPGLPLLRPLRQDQPRGHSGARLCPVPLQQGRAGRGSSGLRGHRGIRGGAMAWRTGACAQAGDLPTGPYQTRGRPFRVACEAPLQKRGTAFQIDHCTIIIMQRSSDRIGPSHFYSWRHTRNDPCGVRAFQRRRGKRRPRRICTIGLCVALDTVSKFD